MKLKLKKKQIFNVVVYLTVHLIILILSIREFLGDTESYSSGDVWDFNPIVYNEDPSGKFWPLGTLNIAYYDINEFLTLGVFVSVVYVIYHGWIKDYKE